MKLRLTLLLLLYTFPIVSAVASDHDTLTQVQQNTLFNNRRLDNQDTRMDKQDARIEKNEQAMQALENEFTNIRGIGIGVLTVGGAQLVLQIVGLLAKPKKNGNGNGNGN